MSSHDIPRDTPAWRFQVWASFLIALGVTLIGIANVPLDLWVRAFLGMGLLFTTGSAFTLSKTLRDELEARRLHNKLAEVKNERILREYELGDGAAKPAA